MSVSSALQTQPSWLETFSNESVEYGFDSTGMWFTGNANNVTYPVRINYDTGYGIDAAMAAAATASATATADYSVTAAAAVSATLSPDPSVLAAGETNKWHHDGALAGRIYRGATRVRKARRGNNVILDQPG